LRRRRRSEQIVFPPTPGAFKIACGTVSRDAEMCSEFGYRLS